MLCFIFSTPLLQPQCTPEKKECQSGRNACYTLTFNKYCPAMRDLCEKPWKMSKIIFKRWTVSNSLGVLFYFGGNKSSSVSINNNAPTVPAIVCRATPPVDRATGAFSPLACSSCSTWESTQWFPDSSG